MTNDQFNWRDKASIQQSDELGKEGYALSKIWIPANDSTLSLGADEWWPVRDIRFTGDDKSYFLGVCASLVLTDNQRLQLLIAYAGRYQKALIMAGEDNPRRMNIANNAANKWLRNGAHGFFIRE